MGSGPEGVFSESLSRENHLQSLARGTEEAGRLALLKDLISRFIQRLQPTVEVGPDGAVKVGVHLRESLSDAAIDERIQNLEKTRLDLLGAVSAVEQLEKEAKERKVEVQSLRQNVEQLKTDEKTAKTVLQVDQASFARVLNAATAATARRSVIIGIVIGLVTGLDRKSVV